MPTIKPPRLTATLRQAKKTVLILEDDPDIRGLLREILAPICTVVEADRPSIAYSHIARSMPDVMIIDICLPEYSGLEFLQRLRNRISGTLPVFMITAHGSRPSAEEALSLGSINYFSKPFQPSHVLEAVKNALWVSSSRTIQNEPKWKKTARVLNEGAVIPPQSRL